MTVRPRYVDIIEEEFAMKLGAEGTIYNEKITLFIAHKTRHELPVQDIDTWIERAEALLSGVGGGATSVQVRGAWLGDRSAPLHETTTLVYTYAAPEHIESHAAAIREFVCEYGQTADQGEVAVLLENCDGDWFFRVDRAVIDRAQ